MRPHIVLHENSKEAPLLERELTDKILNVAIEVHRAIGPGLLESVYQVCMAHEATLRSMQFEQQVPLQVKYKNVTLDAGYRLDFIFERKVIVELKAVDEVLPVHEAQLLTYMKLTGIRVGLLLNFNVPVLKNGIYRRAL